jgi:hypothetical protein
MAFLLGALFNTLLDFAPVLDRNEGLAHFDREGYRLQRCLRCCFDPD